MIVGTAPLCDFIQRTKTAKTYIVIIQITIPYAGRHALNITADFFHAICPLADVRLSRAASA